ncbi:hypothetical protein CDD82_3119 [Ophiocordyceps australis]|uniref:Peptidase S8/S53 domain-containing protein n=1 Tax=Ophiocordyceps australis TaxID=1399860 RepID=A0A2C5ZUR5_9HYPO|nr:hypothetical protein CDD82_3119 [Ophiocordyceps australis]
MKKDLEDHHFETHLDWVRGLHKTLNATDDTDDHPIDVTHSFNGGDYGFRGYAGAFSPRHIELISDHNHVHFVERDFFIKDPKQYVPSNFPRPQTHMFLSSQDASTKTQRYAPWNLHAISHRKPVANRFMSCLWHYSYDAKAGEGTFAYVIDTGVRASHRDFEGRAYYGCQIRRVENACYCERGDHDDNNGHGTHVAGIIASKTYGVAKKASIISVKVFNENGRTYKSDSIQAFHWAVTDILQKGRATRAVINISSGGRRSEAQNMAIDRAFEESGIITVTSSGNDGKPAHEQSPASSSQAITVGSVSKDWSFLSSSNYGPDVNILAPGEWIISLSNTSDGAFKTLSGTSSSAPHVAGLILLSMSAYGISGSVAKQHLLETATRGKIRGDLRGSPNLLANNNNKKQSDSTAHSACD